VGLEERKAGKCRDRGDGGDMQREGVSTIQGQFYSVSGLKEQ
jgi:hypothetical protein